MTPNDPLDENKKSNSTITNTILAVYVGAAVALVVQFFGQIDQIFIDNIGIITILIILSILSITFYFQLIEKIRDTKFGSGLSIALSLVFLILIVASVNFGWFSFVGIGIWFIFFKAKHLHYLIKRTKKLPQTEKYLRNMFIVYFLLAIFSSSLGLVADLSGYQMLSMRTIPEEFESIDKTLRTSTIETSEKQILVQNLAIIKSHIESSNTIINYSFGVSGYLLLILLGWALYRALVYKRLRWTDVLGELRDFYNEQDSDPNGDNNGQGSSRTTLQGLLSIFRPFISIIAGLVAVSVYIATAIQPVVSESLLLFLVVFLTAGYGFIVNDIVDMEKDKIGHPRRALPRELITKKTAITFAFIFSIVSISISSLLPTNAILTNLTTLLLLSVYSYINKHHGFLANIITSVNSAFVLIIGMTVGQFHPLILWTSIAVFFLIFGREIILDIRDIESDKIFSKHSFPIRYGENKSILFSAIFFFFSSLITILLTIGFQDLFFGIFVGIGLNSILWISFLIYAVYRTQSTLRTFLICSRLALLLFLPGVLF